RILYDRFAEITVCISPADALVYRLCEISSHKMYILSDLKEYTSHSCILADRHILIICDLIILDDIVENSFSDLTVLTGTAVADRTFHVFREVLVCLDAESLDHVCKCAYINFTHERQLLPFLNYYIFSERENPLHLLQEYSDKLARQNHKYQRDGVGCRISGRNVVCSGHTDQRTEGRRTCHTAADRAKRIEQAQLHQLGRHKISDDHRDQCDQRSVKEEHKSLLLQDLDKPGSSLHTCSDKEQRQTEFS